jgi:hypothetical protein
MIENYLLYFAFVFTIAILIELFLHIKAVNIELEKLEIMENNEPQNILISEGQAKGIAQIVKKLMDEESK